VAALDKAWEVGSRTHAAKGMVLAHRGAAAAAAAVVVLRQKDSPDLMELHCKEPAEGNCLVAAGNTPGKGDDHIVVAVVAVVVVVVEEQDREGNQLEVDALPQPVHMVEN
jgi:hypothetical protein